MLHKGYYLLIINSNNQVISLDGSHDKQEDVKQALYLHKNLFTAPEGETYKGIHVLSDIPRNDKWTSLLNELYQTGYNLFEVSPSSKGVNQESLKINQIAMSFYHNN